MSTRSIIAVAALAFVGTAAMAQEVAIDNTPFMAAKTRAEVRAEVLNARTRAPSLVSTEVGTDAPGSVKRTPSAMTREQVRAELLKAPRQQRDVGFSAA